MKFEDLGQKLRGITLRTALLSWLVTILTLVIFIIVIIPSQKGTFLENLESQAKTLVVNLEEVAARSVVNEDYSSVVIHCMEVMGNDKTIEYLIITKNGGDSQVFYRHVKSDGNAPASQWNTNKLSAEWYPAQRSPKSGIGVVSLFDRRVFHYSQPFDYSGIQWGWIHVGLSLASYDRSVASAYQRTLILTVICILISLVASLIYAERLVRPIHYLGTVVQKVAGGDLSTRANIPKTEELANLARSINAMTEALLHRDRILNSVRFAAQQFLSVTDWRHVIGAILRKLGESAGISYIEVWEVRADEPAGMALEVVIGWRADNGKAPGPSSPESPIKFNYSEVPQWQAKLKGGDLIMARQSELAEALRKPLAAQGIKSLLGVPIFVEGKFWGILSLMDQWQERFWTEAERDSLRAAADMLGSAVVRHRTQDELLQAKVTLEQRVRERTQQLQEQIKAKEQAHSELAQAQQRLMEASRKAGMAEVATGVLHNVGNVLNSVNVSTQLLYDRQRHSRLSSLNKAAQLIKAHKTDLADYLTTDSRGKLLPNFIVACADYLWKEQAETLTEYERLVEYVNHVNQIVAMQQSYAMASGIVETLNITMVIEDALRMCAETIRQNDIQVIRQYGNTPTVTVDKHKVLQILLNLIRNSKYALVAKAETSGAFDKRLEIQLELPAPDRIRITVRDNGIGIPSENLVRIFSHGFTTKKNGHGFGLHLGALAAREMGGTLIAQSDGPGLGAAFVLELPITPT